MSESIKKEDYTGKVKPDLVKAEHARIAREERKITELNAKPPVQTQYTLNPKPPINVTAEDYSKRIDDNKTAK